MFSVSLSKHTKNTKNTKRRRGFVLVSVLLLGVVFISCATSFAWFARLQIKSALREKASLANRSMAQVLTSSIIAGIKSNTIVKYDSPLLEWFKPFFFPAGDLGMWVVQVVPLDDKIPIRSLFLPDNNTLRNELRKPWEDMWLKLEGRDLVYRVLDFLDKDAKPRMGGAEHESYVNRPLLDLSELLIMEEMTPELLYGGAGKTGVADYCTLWSSGKINLNVAPVQVMEILPGLDKTLAEKIVDYRERDPLRRTADLRQIPGFPAKSVTTLMNLADFSSRYFMIKIELLEDTGGGTSFSVVIDKTAGKVVRWEEI
ncbi:MAG: general secretion pathway protein GspK [Synergistaceae bacterium]|jgi:DNA uptake protein ComE-like DNA-binding protein|nr:general secretion pathway protein GspK [Synergistaceae bacterium]